MTSSNGTRAVRGASEKAKGSFPTSAPSSGDPARQRAIERLQAALVARRNGTDRWAVVREADIQRVEGAAPAAVARRLIEVGACTNTRQPVRDTRACMAWLRQERRRFRLGGPCHAKAPSAHGRIR